MYLSRINLDGSAIEVVANCIEYFSFSFVSFVSFFFFYSFFCFFEIDFMTCWCEYHFQ